MTIVKRKTKTGKLRHTVQIRKMIKGEIFRDARTFNCLKTAKAWERKRLSELDGAESIASIKAGQDCEITIEMLIERE
ncbi:hypothetical protein [Endozoicomonas sp.]|uniref:hypothetical protein n=1 Tax=Endozoicomonas sp. TaxID=1892382 RepID=UPI00383A0122